MFVGGLVGGGGGGGGPPPPPQAPPNLSDAPLRRIVFLIAIARERTLTRLRARRAIVNPGARIRAPVKASCDAGVVWKSTGASHRPPCHPYKYIIGDAR